MDIRFFKVKTRKDLPFDIKDEMEIVEGNIYWFRKGEKLPSDHSRYPNEQTWVAMDAKYDSLAPSWLAEGDLTEVGPQELLEHINKQEGTASLFVLIVNMQNTQKRIDEIEKSLERIEERFNRNRRLGPRPGG